MEIPSRIITNVKSNKKTGLFPSKKNNRLISFESLLERDYIFLIEFDDRVISYLEQPITLEWKYMNKIFKYTPDFKVNMVFGSKLIEVKPLSKYRKLLADEKYRLKLQSAEMYCQNNGLEFEVVTDKDIQQGNILRNVKYLHRYSNFVVDDKVREFIIEIFRDRKQLEIIEIVFSLEEEGVSFQDALRSVYSMIYFHDLTFELKLKLSQETSVWLKGGNK